MKKVILGLLLGMFNIFMAQNIDLKAIKTNIEDEKSEFYYERLITRFQATPELMSDEEVKHLYYGQMFTKYNVSKFDKDYWDVIKHLEKNKRKKAKEHLEKYIEKNPLNLEILIMAVELYKKDNENKYQQYLIQSGRLIEIIKQSGDGKTEETAFYVNDVYTEYFIARILFNEDLRTYQRSSYLKKDGAIDKFTKGDKELFFRVLYKL